MARRYPKGTKSPDRCRHRWQAVAFETEHTGYDLRTKRQYPASQPHMEKARVWLVCLRCASHTYMETAWAGVRLEGSLDRPPGSWEPREYRDFLANLRTERDPESTKGEES